MFDDEKTPRLFVCISQWALFFLPSHPQAAGIKGGREGASSLQAGPELNFDLQGEANWKMSVAMDTLIL